MIKIRMIYLSLKARSVQHISLAKTLLGQYRVSHFEKVHGTDLLEKGRVKNADVVASAIKESLTMAKPEGIKDNDLYLILPQEAFTFARYNVPPDIQTSAIIPFIKDKARADFSFDLDSAYSDFLVVQQEGESTVLLYVLQKEVFDAYSEVAKLLGLSLRALIPETVAFYKLFEKTLKKDKKETILYASYEDEGSYGYLFDSLGLLIDTPFPLGGEFEKELKDVAEKQAKKVGKIDRIILAGTKSSQVRQDLFTKEVGIWTNPLDKIIANFYQEYLKLLVSPDRQPISFLSLDGPLGGFIVHRENPEFSLYKQGGRMSAKGTVSVPSFSLPSFPIGLRDVFVFLISMIITSSVIYSLGVFGKDAQKVKLPSIGMVKPSPTQKPEPTKAPTPTPSFTKESLKVKVLNGTGTPGQAGDVQQVLKDAGYVEVLTGNADELDQSETLIQYAKGMKDAGLAVREDLKDMVDIAESDVSEIDDEDEAAQVIVITGADLE